MNDNLKDDLFRLIVRDFGGGLTSYEYNQYVTKLRDYLLPYLSNKKSNCETVEDIFRYEFTRKDIIDSTVYYVSENENVTRKSSIDDFLIALNRLFDETINIKYFNQNLVNVQPFTSLTKEVENIVSLKGIKKLEDRESYPSISDNEYDLIINYLKNMELSRITDYQHKIIISLLLVYGFSFDRIINLMIDDYSIERGLLSIRYDSESNRCINLELPYSLKLLFDSFIKVRSGVVSKTNSMFVSKEGNKIKHGYISHRLNKIKEIQGVLNNESRNTFTATGLAKYAVIKMILEGMNQSIILNLTGFELSHYSDCQNKVNEIKNLNINRYINKIIRGINIYDDINS